MWRITKTIAVVCSLIILSVVGALYLAGRQEIHVYDGFESDHLSADWSRWRLVEGAFRAQFQVVRAGHRAGEITVRSGDRREAASDDGAATERDELMEAWWLVAHLHRTYRYSFSLYLPPDFPIVPTRLVLAQWKQLCEWVRCRPDNPVLAIRYQDGELFINRQDDHRTFRLYSTGEEMRGRWLDFRFETRFSPGQDGRIDGWLNGQAIVHYQGPTAYQVKLGYPAHGYVYFKMGLYRDEMQQPMTICLDEYRKDELSR
jgi:hypothetical protein